MIELEKLNVRLGTWSQRLAPGYSWCFRCETPWLFVKGHSTDYVETMLEHPGLGCFPLCEKCWAELSPEERLPYYRQLWDHWKQVSTVEDKEWQAIKAAVLAGR